MKLLIKIAIFFAIIFTFTKIIPIDEIYWGYTHQQDAKELISEFYRLYNYKSFSRIYDNVLASQARLRLSKNKFSSAMNRLYKQKGKFITPYSKDFFHYKPLLDAKNLIFDLFVYRDKNIIQNSFYVARKNGRTYYFINFIARHQLGFTQANFVLTDTIDGLKVISPMKYSSLKNYLYKDS